VTDMLWKQLRALMPAPLPRGFPRDTVVLFPPRDNAALALQTLVAGLKVSANLSMFTYTDAKLDALLHTKATSPGFTFQGVLDEGCVQQIASMKALVDGWASDPRMIVGHSEHGQIIHRKILVGDHLYVAGGSTNWTHAGQLLEDNELVIVHSAPLAAYYETVLDANYQRLQALKAAPLRVAA
jgi:phosphatidylserine/phosphatidylglycerophosphate/cardiolipin synthase-like enzyme